VFIKHFRNSLQSVHAWHCTRMNTFIQSHTIVVHFSIVLFYVFIRGVVHPLTNNEERTGKLRRQMCFHGVVSTSSSVTQITIGTQAERRQRNVYTMKWRRCRPVTESFWNVQSPSHPVPHTPPGDAEICEVFVRNG